MKSLVIKGIVSAALVAAAGASVAQSGVGNAFGVVISSTPVVQQVTVPKQICTTTTVHSAQPTGGGALIGAVVGGALGNQFGRGDGRAVATVIGALGGGVLGNQIEVNNGYYSNQTGQPVQQCRTENTVENRTVAQNVLYEYASQRFNVQMPATGDFRPGTRLALQVNAPVTAAPAPLQVYNTVPQAPVQTVTYVNSAAPVVYYLDSYDSYRPRYVHSTPYYVAPRAVVRPLHPVQQVRHGGHLGHHGYGGHYDEYRNWR
jgi:uncharacterized protein YcfJ